MYIDCVIDVLGTPTIPVIPQTDKLPAAQPPLVLPNFSMGAPTGNTIAVYCLLYFLKILRGSMDIELGEVFISLLLNWKGVLYFQDWIGEVLYLFPRYPPSLHITGWYRESPLTNFYSPFDRDATRNGSSK